MRRTIVVTGIVAAIVAAGSAGAARLITGRQIKDGTITGRDVKNHSLRPVDFRGSVRGPAGPAGAPGPQGPAGPAGSFSASSIHQAAGPSVVMGAMGSGTEVQSSTANCPAGTVVIAGGWDGEQSPPVRATVGYNKPLGNGWEVIMSNFGMISATFHAIAVCESASGTRSVATAAQRAEAARAKAQMEAQVRRLR
jgi:hypothetical protein